MPPPSLGKRRSGTTLAPLPPSVSGHSWVLPHWRASIQFSMPAKQKRAWYSDFSWKRTSLTLRERPCPGHSVDSSVNQPSFTRSLSACATIAFTIARIVYEWTQALWLAPPAALPVTASRCSAATGTRTFVIGRAAGRCKQRKGGSSGLWVAPGAQTAAGRDRSRRRCARRTRACIQSTPQPLSVSLCKKGHIDHA